MKIAHAEAPSVRRCARPQGPGARRQTADTTCNDLRLARVSTGGQSVDAQARQLRAAGAGKVFREVASGAKTDRPQLARLVSELAAGDVVMVTRLHPLARPASDLLEPR